MTGAVRKRLTSYTPRNKGKGDDAGARYTVRDRKISFSSKGVIFSLDWCFLMGDPISLTARIV